MNKKKKRKRERRVTSDVLAVSRLSLTAWVLASAACRASLAMCTCAASKRPSGIQHTTKQDVPVRTSSRMAMMRMKRSVWRGPHMLALASPAQSVSASIQRKRERASERERERREKNGEKKNS